MLRTIIILTTWGLQVCGQDSIIKMKPYAINGYVKSLQSLSFDSSFRTLSNTNIIHNRINTRWIFSKQIELHAEFRNRMIWGDEVRMIPNYTSLLRNDNDFLNLQVLWIRQNQYLLVTNTERLWVQYTLPKWKVRLGRQRINWGISTIWNPNDLMNTYNFLDFDYEERPGVDAFKVDHVVSQESSFEAVYVPQTKTLAPIYSLKYNLNKAGYDFQFIAANLYNRYSIGAGWAGNIQNTGFKGEIQYYFPHENKKTHLNISVESDHIFENGWYFKNGFLYNSEGTDQSLNTAGNLNLKLTPLNLMPTKWNLMVFAQKEWTPLLNSSVTIIYAPGTNLLLCLPSVKYNLAENMDLDLVWQSIHSSIEQKLRSLSQKAFLRMKWNF